MLVGQFFGVIIGFGMELYVVIVFSMDFNGNGIIVFNEIWDKMKVYILQENGKLVYFIKVDYLKLVVDEYCNVGKLFNMGMVFLVFIYNYELCYWFVVGGIYFGYYVLYKGDIVG